MLEETDLKVYKSKSQFIIGVLDAYCNGERGNKGKAGEAKDKVLVEDEKYRQEIKDMARDEILHMLGAVIAGRESVSGGYQPGLYKEKMLQEEMPEETEEEIPEDVKNLIGQWSQ